MDIATVFRQRAWHAETTARRATDETAREVLALVAATWRELALDAARRRRRSQRSGASPGVGDAVRPEFPPA